MDIIPPRLTSFEGPDREPHYSPISIDPHLRYLETTPTFEGIGDAGLKLKVAAFADDILLFIDRPKHTLPKLLKELTQIGILSGYTLNLDKTEALLLRGPPKPLWSTTYPFKWQSDSLKYLGVRIAKNPARLYKENIVPYLRNLELTLQTWILFPIWGEQT